MAYTMTYTVVKNDLKEVTRYDIKADGVKVGIARSKDSNREFVFASAWGNSPEIIHQRTMRDLKAEVEQAIPEGYVAANKPAEWPKPLGYTMTYTAIKNDAKEVTHYDIKADGTKVGLATKDDKGNFTFIPNWEDGALIADQKTMHDLKAEVEKVIPDGYVAANKPKP